MVYSHIKARAAAKTLIREAIAEEFGPIAAENIEIIDSRDASLGEFSCPASFKLAAILRKTPLDIAEALSRRIKTHLDATPFSEVSALKGFLNFTLSNGYFSGALSEALKGKTDFGRAKTGKGKKSIVEFSSPNIGKPMHIGHIRSTIMGDAIASVLRFTGFDAVSSNYLCEAGLQTAKLLLSVQMFGKEKIEDEKGLLALYVKIHKEMERDLELEKKAQDLVLKMELGDDAVLRQLSEIRKLSTRPFEKNYELLNVKFDEEVYDSDYVADGKALADEALRKGIAFQDKNGETVADLEKHSLPNLIIIRSNGTTLYSTRDLGLADRDYRKYRYHQRIYVTASEQNLHFQQVFAILKALKKPYADRLTHIGFGLISLEEGKLSTREGRVLLLEDVINESISLALEEVRKRQHYSEADAHEIARVVGVGALKYSVLRISAEKDIKFSMREAVKFDGNTAAYLQYTVVRAQNILRKAEEEKIRITASKIKNYLFAPEERILAMLISQFPGVVEHARKSLAPYIICEYLFKLALQFSSFYDSCPVLKAETEDALQARLKITQATCITLENGISLLGIGIPEKM